VLTAPSKAALQGSAQCLRSRLSKLVPQQLHHSGVQDAAPRTCKLAAGPQQQKGKQSGWAAGEKRHPGTLADIHVVGV
jgi:hypothetical protein